MVCQVFPSEVRLMPAGPINYTPPRVLNRDIIIDTVCQYYKLERWRLFTRSRLRTNVAPRQICMFLIKKHTRESHKSIAMLFNKKDHTTVISAIHTVKNLMATEAQYRAEVNQIDSLL